MSRVVRLGAVDYLNVRPLVDGLDRRADVSLRFDPPAVCARLLGEHAIDVGMVPSITYLDRPGDRVVPGVCIGSDGAVDSVALFSRRPVRDIRSIALDTSSRTSVALLRILCKRRFAIAPSFTPHAPDLHAMLSSADAALLIGDPALFVDAASLGAEKIDLGAEWTSMTGLPFVWAFWAGRADALDGTDVVQVLQDAARRGLGRFDAIASDYCADIPQWTPTARRYLAESLQFQLSAAARAGLEAFFREAVEVGVTPAVRSVEFYSTEPGARVVSPATIERD